MTLLVSLALIVVRVDQWSGVRHAADPPHSASAGSPVSPRIFHPLTPGSDPQAPG